MSRALLAVTIATLMVAPTLAREPSSSDEPGPANIATAQPEKAQGILQLRMGVKLIAVDAKALGDSRFRGGLRVLTVLPESSAAMRGLKEGDILVGLDRWEVIRFDQIAYVLKHGGKTISIWVLRRGEILEFPAKSEQLVTE